MQKKTHRINWKMNGSPGRQRGFVEGRLRAPQVVCDVAVAVLLPHLAQVQALTAGSAIAVAAQDVSAHESRRLHRRGIGGHAEGFGVRYALVGHSERRQYHGETDAIVAGRPSAHWRRV